MWYFSDVETLLMDVEILFLDFEGTLGVLINLKWVDLMRIYE